MNNRSVRTAPFKVLLIVVLAWSQAARCEIDPLNNPAMPTAKASTAMQTAVTQAGQRLISVGEHGIIIYSDNRGGSWTQASVPVSITLTSVFFSDPQHGWAVGHDGVVLSSADRGQTWIKRMDGNQANSLMLTEAEKNLSRLQTVRPANNGQLKIAENALADVQATVKFGPSRPLLGSYFSGTQDGFVIGSYGQIFHTQDGGSHWESLASRMQNPDGLHYNAMTKSIRGTLLIAGEGGKVYRSNDSGHNWQMLDTGYQGQLYGVLGIDQSGTERLLAFGFGGHILLGDASNAHWQELGGAIKKNLIGGCILADGRILLAAQDGTVLQGDAPLRQFVVVRKGTGMAIAGMSFIAESKQLALSGTGGVHVVTVGTAASANRGNQ